MRRRTYFAHHCICSSRIELPYNRKSSSNALYFRISEMENHIDAVNLADVDVVKNTQFSQDDYSGFQTPAGPERLVFGQLHHPQYNHPQDNRGPTISQIHYNQHQIWPSYAPGYGRAIHPMQQTFASGYFSPYSNTNFASPSAPYGGVAYVGPDEGIYHHKSKPLSYMPSANFSGQSHYERQKENQHAEPQRSGGNNSASRHGPTLLCRKENVVGDGKRAHTPLEVRQSPPPKSPESHQGLLPSDNIEADKDVSTRNGPRQQTNPTTPTKSRGSLQNAYKDSSKSNTPYSLSQRKALRAEEKSYMKEVKMAIAEGRVPRVTVLQDDSGNIVRYKPQFMNALKLAAHTIVQEAYINVNETDTMNEIMEEVGRQFKLSLPLPNRLVEGYLLRYFKRCRSQYHKFWIKHGDAKRPDDCKPTAWVQLIEYWESPEGSKECHQNKKNASAQKPPVAKQKAGSECFEWDDDAKENLLFSPTHPPWKASSISRSDSLGFDDVVRGRTKTPSPKATGNPMADISNQLHDAVDNILSSFVARCGSQASTDPTLKTQIPPLLYQNVEASQCMMGGTRTTAEVLSSLRRPRVLSNLRRPRVGEDSILFPRNAQTTSQGQSQSKENTHDYGTSNQYGRPLQYYNFDTKGSVNDSSGKVRRVISVGTGNAKFNSQNRRTLQNNSAIGKEEPVVLSSDPSSEGPIFPRKNRRLEKWEKDKNGTSQRVYTEEIEGGHNFQTASWGAGSPQRTENGNENVKRRRNYMSETNHRLNLKQKLPLGEENDGKGDVGTAVGVGGSSKFPRMSSQKPETNVGSDDGMGSEEEALYEEQKEINAELYGESDKEEAPVLPRDVVKRKLESEYHGSSIQKDSRSKGKKKANKTQTRKPKATQIDMDIITKLEFFKRAKNSNPIKPKVRVSVLHPKFVGKVVAEAYAGVNRKSRCVDSANEVCQDGQQMIFVIRVFYQDKPVMYDRDKRFPKHIQLLDQVEGLTNTPILWCIAHLIEVPPLEQVTRLLGDYMPPSSQKFANSDSDFEDNNKSKNVNSKICSEKENRKGRSAYVSTPSITGSKGSRIVKKH